MANEVTTPAAASETGKPGVEVSRGESASPASAPPVAAKDQAADAPEARTRKKKPGVAPRRGKKLRNHLASLERKIRDQGLVSIKQAVSQLKSFKRARFDETVEIHMNLGIDATQSDQMVRGAVSLPHGIGKSVRVAVFTQGDNAAKAKAAGADVVGGADLVEKVQKENWLEFDVAIATQDMMGQVSRLGKVLGPRGLMPTPKAGTVIPVNGDIAKVVQEFKAGKVEYRSDKTGQVHAGVGKLSFDEAKLVENITTFIEQVRAAKPSGVKGTFINGVVISATMSPGIPVSV